MLSELQSRDDRVPLRAKPVLKFHPGYGCILMCDFSHQAVPEMVKTRPVVVISRKAANSQLCTVVPLSSTEPDPKHPWHAKMTREKMPASLRGKECWAKCDCVATVSFARLDRIRHKHPQTGARVYSSPKLYQPDLDAIREALLSYFGMADLIRVR